jgi:hypothetical protein
MHPFRAAVEQHAKDRQIVPKSADTHMSGGGNLPVRWRIGFMVQVTHVKIIHVKDKMMTVHPPGFPVYSQWREDHSSAVLVHRTRDNRRTSVAALTAAGERNVHERASTRIHDAFL